MDGRPKKKLAIAEIDYGGQTPDPKCIARALNYEVEIEMAETIVLFRCRMHSANFKTVV